MRALVYGDLSLNLIDGSSVWLTSACDALSEICTEVHLLLKEPVHDDRLVRSISALPNVVIHPHRVDASGCAVADAPRLTPRSSAQRLAALTQQLSPDLVLVRGLAACASAATNDGLASLLWAYITDVPFPPPAAQSDKLERLRTVAGRARRMFAQTESARSYLEALAPQSAGKTVILSPMVPNDLFDAPLRQRVAGDPLRLVYSGKFAKDWRTLEMLELPALLGVLGVEAELCMIGDKFQQDPSDPAWAARMEQQLSDASADPRSKVTWLGGLPRASALAAMRRADIGLSWRTGRLDAGVELSTKALEYSAAGVPPLVGRTDQHVNLWGTDYPLLVDTDDAAAVARAIRDAVPAIDELRGRVRRAAEPHSIGAVARRLGASASRAHLGAGARTARPLRVVVASHDLKFAGELMDYLEASPDFDVRIDAWTSLHTHDETVSEELAAWADVVLCEWAGPNMIWYQQHKRPGQRLIVRLHRFELGAPWMARSDFSLIDSMVFVSDHIRAKAADTLDIPPHHMVVIPNTVDAEDLARPKLPGSEYRLGLVGIVGFLKRPDRALDLLEALVERDHRYTLHIKGRMPWEYPHEWNNALQRQLYLEFFGRIRASEALRESVVFEPFSPDIASWLRKIGVVLSCSSLESFHLAPAEGMASGAVPIFWPREGVVEVFGARNVFSDLNGARDYVLGLRDRTVFEHESAWARRHAQRWDHTTVLPAWRQLLWEERDE